ncbi:dTDP-4-dehydrorhamnose 3,5-epimerase [Clostridiaceae bacterium M8S5]|nr:dTDP-4-dehydrorhamnose 3,5-epimerase [Clostridiaceae bacterium M8S5]
MKVINTQIKDVMIVEPKVHEDNRGWFMESYSLKKLLSKSIDVNFVQDNHSLSKVKGTLRGLHFQNNPKAQAKLIRCTKGAILDVVVDIRRESPTYKKWIKVVLSEENKKQLFIPKGFAHGFLTLVDNTEIQYKVDEYYSKEHDRCIRYNDSELSIEWDYENPILSQKDLMAPFLKDSDYNF